MERIELVFRKRLISQSKLYRDIIKSARCEAPIKVPQTRHDHPDNWDLDVEPCLVKDEEVEALLLGGPHASHNLLAPIEAAELRVGPDRIAELPLGTKYGWSASRIHRRMAKPCITTPHETDGQKLTEFGHRPQNRYSRIEVRARTKLDVFLRVFRPMRHRHKAREFRNHW